MSRHTARVGALAASTVALGLVAGCASKHEAGSGAPAATFSAAQATATLNGDSVTLHVGQRVDVAVPGAVPASGQTTSYTVTPNGSGVLTPIAGSAGSFVGAAPGTAKVVVSETPVCEPGKQCAAHIIELGTVSVTVTG